MSLVASQGFDYWEFVDCVQCHLPFISPDGFAIPFWLTECGHVVCNNHLNPDQSCAHCGSSGIQLAPLQKEMDAPMSDWFRPLSSSLDSISFAVKFQQESMASQIRYLKSKCQQQRIYIDRLKQEVASLKNTNRLFQHRTSMDRPPRIPSTRTMNEPGDGINSNGKRRMAERPRPTTASSGHSGSLAGRLTLPPGQHPPQLSSRQAKGHEHISSKQLGQISADQRPGSTWFNQKYSFIDPQAQEYCPRQQDDNRYPIQQSRMSKLNMENMDPNIAQPSIPRKLEMLKPLVDHPAVHHQRDSRTMGPPLTASCHQKPSKSNVVPHTPILHPTSSLQNRTNRFEPPAQDLPPVNVIHDAKEASSGRGSQLGSFTTPSRSSSQRVPFSTSRRF